MAKGIVHQVSRRDFVKAAASLPLVAALAPILPAKAETSTPNVSPWHAEGLAIYDADGRLVGCAVSPELASAIAGNGGYTLPEPSGPMAETMLSWDDASRQQMAAAREWEPESWPGQVDTFARWTEGVEPHCESSVFDSDAERRRAVITTVGEWGLTPQHARLDAAIDALRGLLVRGSLEARLLTQVEDAATALYVAALQAGIEAADAMGAAGVPDVEPEQLTVMARALEARL